MCYWGSISRQQGRGIFSSCLESPPKPSPHMARFAWKRSLCTGCSYCHVTKRTFHPPPPIGQRSPDQSPKQSYALFGKRFICHLRLCQSFTCAAPIFLCDCLFNTHTFYITLDFVPLSSGILIFLKQTGFYHKPIYMSRIT